MAEAQTFASGCLRLISLDEDNKGAVMAAGAARYLPPLLDSRCHLARWHTRQTMLNLAMDGAHARDLALYDVPNFVTGQNVPTVQYLHRPVTAPAALAGALQPLRVVAAGPPRTRWHTEAALRAGPPAANGAGLPNRSMLASAK